MTTVATKSAGDRITSADLNAILGKIQNATDEVNPLTLASVVFVTGFTSTRIQNAINSLTQSGGKILLRAGDYTLGTTIKITKPIILSGVTPAGQQANIGTRLISNVSPAVWVYQGGTFYEGFTIENMNIRPTTTGTGIQIESSVGVFRNVQVGRGGLAQGSASVGYCVSGSVTNSFLNCYANNLYRGYVFEQTGSVNSNSNMILGGRIISNSYGAILYDNCQNNYIMKCDFSGNSNIALNMPAAKNTIIEACWFENNTGTAVSVDGTCDQTRIQHCLFGLTGTQIGLAFLAPNSYVIENDLADGVDGTRCTFGGTEANSTKFFHNAGFIGHALRDSSVSNATTILHGLSRTPRYAWITSQSATPLHMAVTALARTTLTVGVWNTSASAISNTRAYWYAEV